MPFDGTPFAAQAAPAWSDCAHPMMYVSIYYLKRNGPQHREDILDKSAKTFL